MQTPTTLHDEGWRATQNRSQIYADPTTPEREQKLLATLAPLGSSARVLDSGCGRGHFTYLLHNRRYRPIGIDLSPTAVELNRTDFPDITFEAVEGDRPVPFLDGQFDAVWSSEVVEHVYDVHGMFAEYCRLLRPGGLIILTTPYHGLLKNVLLVAFAFDRHFNVEWQHIRFWSKHSLKFVGAAHNFVSVNWDHVGRSWLLPKSFFAVYERRVG